MKRHLRFVALLVALASGTVACGGGGSAPAAAQCDDPEFGERVVVSSVSGTENGLAYVHINGVMGTAEDVTYEWSNGHKGPDLDDVEPGVYTVTITSSSGCTATETYDMTGSDGDTEEYRVGDTGPGGGIVFEVNGDGSGLEAAPFSTIWTDKTWGCDGTEVDTSQSDGQTNTARIVSECAEDGIAAKLCDELDVGGFHDWYLPSDGELDSMGYAFYNADITGMPQGTYWSSTEAIETQAYVRRLPGGSGEPQSKSGSASVIAIRAFGE